ncbi:MAG: chemotaxis protein, partial [Dongiaceae bacterium]
MSATTSSRNRHQVNFWPGFVDVLSTLLMVVIFLLMVFVIAQFFLSEALTGRDAALERLNRQIAELSEMLSLERSASAELRVNVAELSAELQTSIAARDDLSRRLTVIIGERDALAADMAEASARLAVIDETGAAVQAKLDEAYSVIEAERAKLAEAYQTIEADREKIEALLTDIAALESLRDELSAKLLAGDQEVAAEQQISEEAQRRVEILNRQLIALRQQLARLAAALDASEEQSREQEIQVADLGHRLNAALASRVEELARYRSEFFGRLRQVLGSREDIQIVGDRFVFQSEVLFETGSAELGEPG